MVEQENVKEKIENLEVIETPYVEIDYIHSANTVSDLLGWCRLNENRLNVLVKKLKEIIK